jgi:hypothetical protein
MVILLKFSKTRFVETTIAGKISQPDAWTDTLPMSSLSRVPKASLLSRKPHGLSGDSGDLFDPRLSSGKPLVLQAFRIHSPTAAFSTRTPMIAHAPHQSSRLAMVTNILCMAALQKKTCGACQ